MAKTKVFVSYDYDNDAPLKETLIGQSKLPDAPFSINDVSLKETIADWQQKARDAIASCDVFVILLGDDTHKSGGVLRELRMARQLNKNRFQLRKQGHMPVPLDGAGEVIVWKWKNLKKQLIGKKTSLYHDLIDGRR